MWKSSNGMLYIDMRNSVEVLQLGSLENADAHIPYTGSDMDEWSELYKAYSNPANNIFLLCVDELVMDHGLSRNCAVCLICSSYRRGLRAANILSVAGYGKVLVELGGQSDCNTSVSLAMKSDRDVTCMWNDVFQGAGTDSAHLGGWLH